MDGISLLVGGMLGMMAGWAFALASAKQREARKKLSKASKASEEMAQKKEEAKGNQESSLTDKVQGFFLNILGLGVVACLGIILLNSLG
jgi:gas vesicle protein